MARTSILLSDDVCRRCNLACDRLFTFVKFLHAPFWRPGTYVPPLPPLRCASARSNPEKGVNKPFENALFQRRIQNFFTEGGSKFLHFFKRFFFGSVNSKRIEEQKYGSRKVQDMLSRRMFENLDTVLTILVLFEQFLRQRLFNFLVLPPSPPPHMIHFRTLSIHASFGRKDHCCQTGSRLWKSCMHQK